MSDNRQHFIMRQWVGWNPWKALTADRNTKAKRGREFDATYWESVWKNRRIPDEVRKSSIRELDGIFSKTLPAAKQSLCEIGCAIGGWLSYFNRYHDYSVNGIEYAVAAYLKTLQNLEALNIQAGIWHCDFFEFNHEPFDVVFSNGFIEHFENVRPVIERIVNLAKRETGIVITIIPNMSGINWGISKIFRPSVAAGHYPISKQQIRELHESFGLTTVHCGYLGSLKFILPIQKNIIAQRYPRLSFILNTPVKIWNRSVDTTTRLTGLYPQTAFLCQSIIYIGRRHA